MEFVERVLRVAICSLLIYGCFEGNVVQIGAQKAALSESTNNGGGEEISIVLLNDEFRKVLKSEHRKITKRDVESKEPVDDEDTNILANVSIVSPSKVKIDISPTRKYEGNSSDTVAINPQYRTPGIMSASIDAIVTTRFVKSSIHTTSIVSSKIRATETFSELLSRSAIINPKKLPTTRPITEEGTPKGGSDVETQKDPKESERRKTLFGFVTIEILVALLAGAACAVILLIFLVYRLKKRNEGSYELQESMSLKTAAYAEEKEVFV